MKYKKTAIIFGITKRRLQKGYKVIGTTRDKSIKNLYRLREIKY